MFDRWSRWAVAAVIAVGGAAGCSSDRPHEYGQQRQPVDELNPDDSGLQSKDVVSAADKMSRELLSDPTLNASSTAWTIVVDTMDDQTVERYGRVNFDIFLQALKGDLAQKSGGRVQLIENKAKFHDLRNRELEGGDQFGQGAAGQPAPAAINPQYSLTGKAMDLPNRATNFYQIEFTLVNLHNRTIAFDRLYQVKVAR